MPGSPLYLLDSSVIAKWFVQEEDSDKALEIRDLFIQKKHRVSTISLLRYELGNVLWKHPAKSVESVREDYLRRTLVLRPFRSLGLPGNVELIPPLSKRILSS